MSFKKTLLTIGISIGLGLLYFLGFFFIRRGIINRSGVQPDNGLTGRIKDGNQRVADGLKSTQGTVDGVAGDLGERVQEVDNFEARAGSIEDKLSTAIGILRAAKEKNKTDMD